MTTYLSEKIKIVSFFSILLVVFLHAFNLDVAETTVPLFFGSNVWFLQDFISYGLTRIAVPLFFLFSGFLFFMNMLHGTGFLPKIKKRFRTLFIPFLLWSLFGIAFYFTLQSIPQTAVFFTKEHIADFSFEKWLLTIFVHPIPYQLWFIRDLMLLVLLSPLLFYILKYFKFWIFIPVAFFWIYVTNDFQNSIEALLFFLLGGYFALFHQNAPEIRYDRSVIWLSVIWILILTVKTLMVKNGFDALQSSIVFKLSIMTGILAFWGLYDVWIGKIQNKNGLLQLCGFTFFIYAAHEPILTIFKKVLFILFGKTQTGHLLVYPTAPVLTILSVFCAGFILRKYFRMLYETLTGGR